MPTCKRCSLWLISLIGAKTMLLFFQLKVANKRDTNFTIVKDEEPIHFYEPR